MAWTEIARKRYERKADRYSSDLSDAEWSVVAPLLPGPDRLGRPCEVRLRDIWDAIRVSRDDWIQNVFPFVSGL